MELRIYILFFGLSWVTVQAQLLKGHIIFVRVFAQMKIAERNMPGGNDVF